jgi:hypothetical protein
VLFITSEQTPEDYPIVVECFNAFRLNPSPAEGLIESDGIMGPVAQKKPLSFDSQVKFHDAFAFRDRFPSEGSQRVEAADIIVEDAFQVLVIDEAVIILIEASVIIGHGKKGSSQIGIVPGMVGVGCPDQVCLGYTLSIVQIDKAQRLCVIQHITEVLRGASCI